MAMPKPLAVIFDLGGVLIDWNPRYMYRSLFPDDEEGMEWFLTNVTTQEWNEQQDLGRDWDEGLGVLIAEHPDRAELIHAYRERWLEMLGGAHEETLEILVALRAAAVPLYALTNWSADTFALARDRFPFLGWFRGIVVSGQEHLIKPDERIFRLLLERFNLESGATLFIDDNRVNVEQARQMGIDAIHFTNAVDLRSALVERDLLG